MSGHHKRSRGAFTKDVSDEKSITFLFSFSPDRRVEMEIKGNTSIGQMKQRTCGVACVCDSVRPSSLLFFSSNLAPIATATAWKLFVAAAIPGEPLQVVVKLKSADGGFCDVPPPQSHEHLKPSNSHLSLTGTVTAGSHSTHSALGGSTWSISSTGGAPPPPEPIYSWRKGPTIGQGANGRVILAIETQTGRLMAVKEVRNSLDRQGIRSLQREIEVLSRLSHPNIVPYLGTTSVPRGHGYDGEQPGISQYDMENMSLEEREGVNGKDLFIFLEYEAGGSLSSLLKKFGAFSEAMTKRYTRQIVEGLLYLHTQKVIHRDIKGSNVLADTAGNVKLSDFGASKFLQDDSSAHTFRGTPCFMAPEVVQQNGYGMPADVWSLGVTVVQMALGKPPLSDLPPVTVMFKIGLGQVEYNLPDSYSREAKDFVACCLRKSPAQRPTAAELMSHPFLKTSPGPTAPSSTTIPGPTPKTDLGAGGSDSGSRGFRNSGKLKNEVVEGPGIWGNGPRPNSESPVAEDLSMAGKNRRLSAPGAPSPLAAHGQLAPLDIGSIGERDGYDGRTLDTPDMGVGFHDPFASGDSLASMGSMTMGTTPTTTYFPAGTTGSSHALMGLMGLSGSSAEDSVFVPEAPKVPAHLQAHGQVDSSPSAAAIAEATATAHATGVGGPMDLRHYKTPPVNGGSFNLQEGTAAETAGQPPHLHIPPHQMQQQRSSLLGSTPASSLRGVGTPTSGGSIIPSPHQSPLQHSTVTLRSGSPNNHHPPAHFQRARAVTMPMPMAGNAADAEKKHPWEH